MSEVYAHRGHANIRTHRTNEFALDIDDTATTGFAASSTAIPPAETNVPSLQDVGIEADAASRTDREHSRELQPAARAPADGRGGRRGGGSIDRVHECPSRGSRARATGQRYLARWRLCLAGR